MQILANNRIWIDIFHCYEKEKTLLDFKIERGRRFLSQTCSRVRCCFFRRNEMSEIFMILG